MYLILEFIKRINRLARTVIDRTIILLLHYFNSDILFLYNYTNHNIIIIMLLLLLLLLWLYSVIRQLYVLTLKYAILVT